MAKEILCAFGVDVDAVAGWLGSYGGEDSPLDISRGMFSGEVGTPRLVKLFERFGIKTTWFVPGHSMETFPQQIRMVVDAGHEIEIPASWYLDDLPPMMFIKAAPNSHGFVNPHDIEQIWRDQFDWVYREYDYAVFPMTIHPDVSGRPQVLMMLERLYSHIIRHPGVRFARFDEIADDFAKRSRRQK